MVSMSYDIVLTEFFLGLDFWACFGHASAMGITEGELVRRGKYWHWRYRVEGVQRKKSLKVTRLGEARRIRQALIAEYNEVPAHFTRPDRNPTVEEFWDMFEPYARDHKRPGTVASDQQAWEKIVRFTGARRVGDITPRHIERLKTTLKKSGFEGRPVAIATINRVLRHLKAIFNQGIRQGLFRGPNPVLKVELYKTTKTIPDFLTGNEVERLLDAAKEHSQEIHWVILLGVYLGLRKNEIVNCRWEWFNFHQRMVKVTKSNTFQIKDHEERTIPLSKRLIEALTPHRQESGYLFEERKRPGKVGRYRFDPHRDFRIVAIAAGVPNSSLQQCRRTFGSLLAQEGVSIFKISRWMGHSSVNVTARHYLGLQEFDDDIDKI